MRTTKPVTDSAAATGRESRPRGKAKTLPPVPPPSKSPVVAAAVGRRKTAVARVRLIAGNSGEVMVNGKPLDEYFRPPYLQEVVRTPLKLTGKAETLVGSVKVSGGGIHSQAEAVRHGISRALIRLEPTLRPTLKPHGFLRRDPRMKERKKPGLRRARRAPQWAKR